MKPEIVLAYEFVEHIPEELKERMLYISKTHGTAAHKCCCGCGREVVTPLSPTGWQLTFDGQVGFALPLYRKLEPALPVSLLHHEEQGDLGAAMDEGTDCQGTSGRRARAKERYYAEAQSPPAPQELSSVPPPTGGQPRESLWQMIQRWFS